MNCINTRSIRHRNGCLNVPLVIIHDEIRKVPIVNAPLILRISVVFSKRPRDIENCNTLSAKISCYIRIFLVIGQNTLILGGRLLSGWWWELTVIKTLFDRTSPVEYKYLITAVQRTGHWLCVSHHTHRHYFQQINTKS